MPSSPTPVCRHGVLARSCYTCQLEARVRKLEAALALLVEAGKNVDPYLGAAIRGGAEIREEVRGDVSRFRSALAAAKGRPPRKATVILPLYPCPECGAPVKEGEQCSLHTAAEGKP